MMISNDAKLVIDTISNSIFSGAPDSEILDNVARAMGAEKTNPANPYSDTRKPGDFVDLYCNDPLLTGNGYKFIKYRESYIGNAPVELHPVTAYDRVASGIYKRCTGSVYTMPSGYIYATYGVVDGTIENVPENHYMDIIKLTLDGDELFHIVASYMKHWSFPNGYSLRFNLMPVCYGVASSTSIYSATGNPTTTMYCVKSIDYKEKIDDTTYSFKMSTDYSHLDVIYSSKNDKIIRIGDYQSRRGDDSIYWADRNLIKHIQMCIFANIDHTTIF